MKHLSRPCLGRGRLAVAAAAAAFALSGIVTLHAGPASAQGCDGGMLSTSKGNLIGSAVGGAAGGLLGNQFGSGTGKGVMTGLGVVGGALAGGYVGRSVEGCDRGAPRAAASASASPQAVRRVSHHAAGAAAAAPVPAQASASEPRTCRSVLSQAVIDGREQQIEGIACLDPDGIWRSASGSAAERAAEADLVFRTQQRLHDQGFYVRNNIDGQWGPATSSAVRNFQRANGMTPTGQIDVPTRTALGLDPAPLAATATVPPPANGVGAEPVAAGAAAAAPVPMPANAGSGSSGG